MWEGADFYVTESCLNATDPPTAQGRTEEEAPKAAGSKHDNFASKTNTCFI